jgi:hypothetical protein
MRKVLVIAAVIALAVPAIAQIAPIQIQQVTPPPVIQVAPKPSDQATFDVANDPERARALIASLRAKNRELRTQMGMTLGDLQALRTELDEMTRRGGTLVRAQCVSDTLSRRTDGEGEENCAASGYTCASVEGTCHRSCNVSSECSAGFVCDTSVSRCVVPSAGE